MQKWKGMWGSWHMLYYMLCLTTDYRSKRGLTYALNLAGFVTGVAVSTRVPGYPSVTLLAELEEVRRRGR